jgi:hypothetical protein
MSAYQYYHPDADARAREYIGTDQELKVLGWGVDGVVHASPIATTAVKVHSKAESFAKELAAYLRLRDHGVTEFMGFRVPRLVGYDRQRQVIEMSIVAPPFLLDFAAATVDTRPDFTDDAMEAWWQEVKDNFGDDFEVVSDVFWGLQRLHGIWYWDLKPRNLQISRG